MNKFSRQISRFHLTNSIKKFGISRGIANAQDKLDATLDKYKTEEEKAYFATWWIHPCLRSNKLEFYRGFSFYKEGNIAALIKWHGVLEAEKGTDDKIYTERIWKLIEELRINCQTELGKNFIEGWLKYPYGETIYSHDKI